MPNEPLTQARYPDSTYAATIWTWIQQAVTDLADQTITGPFADATARDSAFASWVASGGVLRQSLLAALTGKGIFEYDGANWISHRGLVGMASATTTFTTAAAAEERNTLLNLSGLSMRSGSTYEAVLVGRSWPSVADVVHTLRLRASGSGTPTTSSTAILSHQIVRAGATTGAAPDFKVSCFFTVQTSGTFTVAPFLTAASGTASMGNDARGRSELFVRECGPAVSGLVTVV